MESGIRDARFDRVLHTIGEHDPLDRHEMSTAKPIHTPPHCAFHERVAASSRCGECGVDVCLDCFAIVAGRDVCGACREASRTSPAKKPKRVAARAIDQAIFAAAFFLPLALVPADVPASLRWAIVAAAMFGVGGRQLQLLLRQGQTLGKAWLDLAVVPAERASNAKRALLAREVLLMGALHLPLLLLAGLVVAEVRVHEVFATLGRSLPRVIHLFTTIPGTIVLLSFFRREGAPIHDTLTGTRVIEVGPATRLGDERATREPDE